MPTLPGEIRRRRAISCRCGPVNVARRDIDGLRIAVDEETTYPRARYTLVLAFRTVIRPAAVCLCQEKPFVLARAGYGDVCFFFAALWDTINAGNKNARCKIALAAYRSERERAGILTLRNRQCPEQSEGIFFQGLFIRSCNVSPPLY